MDICASFFKTKSTSRLPSRSVIQFQLLKGSYSNFLRFMQLICFLSIQNLELQPLKTKDSISVISQLPVEGSSSNFSTLGPISRSSLFVYSSWSIYIKRPCGTVLWFSPMSSFSSRVTSNGSLTSIRLLKAFS